MERLLILLLFVLACISCQKDSEIKQNLTACFDYSPKTDISNGVELTFTNCSQNAVSYLWDFGDGTTSTIIEPKHIFTNGGSYKVILLAQDHELVDINADGRFDLYDATVPKDTTSIIIMIK
jgi:hypothetical protein